MATAVVLTGITCRLDQDADPEQLYCVWRGNEVTGGSPITLETSVDPGDTMDAALETAATAADFEIE